MKGLKTMLFGIALICFSGFLAVGQAVGFPFLSPLYWLMLLGLGICFVGLLTNDSDERGGADAGPGDDGNSGNEESAQNGRVEADDGNDDDDEDEQIAHDERYYSPNRFPPT